MRRSTKTHSVKKEQSCDICGDIGFAHALSTCCICHISREHIYCMKYNLHEVPKEWFCEACSTNNMKDPPRENQLCKKRKALCTESDSPRNTGNSSIISNSPRNSPFSPSKNYIKVVQTGKVKFLPAEDVVALTSGTSRANASTLCSGLLSSQVGSLRAPRYPISRKTPISVAEASKCYSQKESTCRSSRPPTPLMDGSVKQSTSLQQEVDKTSPQDKPAKEKSNEPIFLDKPVKVLVMPNEDYVHEKPLHVNPPKVSRREAVYRAQIASNASSPLLEAELNVLPKAKELPNHFAKIPTWKGMFEILGGCFPGVYYVRAHPPCRVSRKAYEFSKQMPITLQFKVHPRGDVWPEIFRIDCPTGDDIALYFLPEDFSSSKEKYYSFLQGIEREDLAMSTCLNGVELMIFTSTKLPMDSQRLNMEFFLWGVFQPSKKRPQLSPSVSEEISQVVDMEIDMVGGEDIGRVDYVVKKPILEGNKVQFTTQTPKLKYPISSALDFQKLNSSKNGDGVAGSWNDEAGTSPNVVSNVHSDQPMKRNISPISKIKREMSTDFSAPPGFSRIVTSDVAHKGVLEKPSGRVPTNMRNLEQPPGFSKFIKAKDDPSDGNDKKAKAAIGQSSSERVFKEFKESSLLSHKHIKDRESPEFISQKVVNHGFPKNPMAPNPTPSAEKSKFLSEHRQFKTDTMKCQLEQCVKKEPMEETDSPRMLSLSRVYMKEEHLQNTGIAKESLKQEGFGSDCDQ